MLANRRHAHGAPFHFSPSQKCAEAKWNEKMGGGVQKSHSSLQLVFFIHTDLRAKTELRTTVCFRKRGEGFEWNRFCLSRWDSVKFAMAPKELKRVIPLLLRMLLLHVRDSHKPHLSDATCWTRLSASTTPCCYGNKSGVDGHTFNTHSI